MNLEKYTELASKLCELERSAEVLNGEISMAFFTMRNKEVQLAEVLREVKSTMQEMGEDIFHKAADHLVYRFGGGVDLRWSRKYGMQEATYEHS